MAEDANGDGLEDAERRLLEAVTGALVRAYAQGAANSLEALHEGLLEAAQGVDRDARLFSVAQIERLIDACVASVGRVSGDVAAMAARDLSDDGE